MDSQFNKEEFLKKIEKIVKKNSRGSGFGRVLTVLFFAAVSVILGIVLLKINSVSDGFEQLTTFAEPAERHDLVLDNKGLAGYTAADFADAILGTGTREKKLEVMTQRVSDAGTLITTGLFNWNATKKTQLITYKGEVTYTVDLSGLDASDISFDEEEKVITMTIPHAVQGEIHIPSDQIQFGDVDRGMLAFGDIKATPEQVSKVQTEAAAKMQERLDEDNVIAEADRFAVLSVWEVYSPIVKSVSRDCSLEVKFRE